MATKAQASKMASDFGATIEADPQFGQADAFTPEGWLWSSNGCSVYSVNYGYSGDMPSVWADLIEGMEGGLIEAPADYEGAWWE